MVHYSDRQAGGRTDISVNIRQVTVREQADIERVARELAQRLERAQINMF